MAISERQLLDSLSRLPLIDSAELALIFGEPHATVHRSLTGLVRRLVTSMVRCQTELYKAYTEDGDFRKWLNGEMFRATYQDTP